MQTDAGMNEWISFFYLHPHLLSDAVHHLLQPVNVQLQGDRQQLLSKSKQQRLQVRQSGQQLRGSGELPGGVIHGAADTPRVQSGSLHLSERSRCFPHACITFPAVVEDFVFFRSLR